MVETEKASVLIVEDEPALSELFKAYLESEYDVYTATSGPEALEIADQEVDVILLDRRMPTMSGDDVLDELRSRGINAQIAMVSGVDPDADIVDMPFDDYLTKPVTKSDLLGIVEVLLLRSTYDDRCQQFFSLAAKKLALEESGNTSTEEYQELVDRMVDLRSELEETVDRLCIEDAHLDGISLDK